MRFGIVTIWGCSLSVALRLIDEGHQAILYCDPGTPPSSDDAKVGNGLVPKATSYNELCRWVKEGHGVLVFDGSGEGKKADAARTAGLNVLGAGAFCDRLENDRPFGAKIAAQAGLHVPPTREFHSLSEVEAWAPSLKVPAYFKSDRYIDSDATHKVRNGAELRDYIKALRQKAPDRMRCIVQKKIDGVALSGARWWNGRAWNGPMSATIEHKAAWNDDVGPATGCSLNAVWFHRDPKIEQRLCWEAIGAAFRKHQAPPALYDLNCIIDPKGTPWFLEWTPRFGFDSEPTSFPLYEDLGESFRALALGEPNPLRISPDLAMSVRLSLPPYPWEHVSAQDKHTAIGSPIFVPPEDESNFIPYSVMAPPDGSDGLECAAADGIIGLSADRGRALSKMGDRVMEVAKAIEAGPLQYRTDAAKVIAADASKLKASGWAVHPDLLR